MIRFTFEIYPLCKQSAGWNAFTTHPLSGEITLTSLDWVSCLNVTTNCRDGKGWKVAPRWWLIGFPNSDLGDRIETVEADQAEI